MDDIQSFNWLLIGVTAVMTVFITYMRVNDYLKHKALLKEVRDRGVELEIIHQDKRLMSIYAGMTVFVLVMSMLLEGELMEKIAMAVTFSVLIGTEIVSAWMNSRVYASSKEFIYGTITERFRSLKTFTPKGKRQTVITTLSKAVYTVPNNVAAAIQAKIASQKNAKK